MSGACAGITGRDQWADLSARARLGAEQRMVQAAVAARWTAAAAGVSLPWGTGLRRTPAPPSHPMVAARLAAGLTQRGLAARMGLTHSVVSHWESGRQAPRLARVPAIAAALGVEPAVVAGWFLAGLAA